MPHFVDSKQTVWPIRCDVATLKRCQSLLGHNPLDHFDKDFTIVQKLANPIYLVDLLWCVCEPQASKEQIGQEEFASRFAGDVLFAARDALLQGMIDFFPDSRRRELLTAVFDKIKALETSLINKGLGELPGLAGLDADRLANDVWNSLIKTRGSSDLTPDRLP